MFAMIVENFAAWAARASIAHRPEIVSCRDADDPVFGQTSNLAPQVKRFVIGMINGDGQPVGVQPPDLGHQRPRVRDRLFLKIIAKRKIAQHFKECVMPRGIADIVEIIVFAASTYAFLAGRRTRNRTGFKTSEVVFERHHSGVDEHQRRVVIRNQRCGLHNVMVIAPEIIEEGAADIVG